MKTIKEILMQRDGMSSTEADLDIKLAKETLAEYVEDGDLESAEDICNEFWGLEPDYLMELM